MDTKGNESDVNLVITNIRNKILSYSNKLGLNDPKTLDCMIELADKLKEIDTKSEKLQLERINLYQTAIENLTDRRIRIKTKLKLLDTKLELAIVQKQEFWIWPEECNANFFRDLINDSSGCFGRDSKETFRCVELFLQSYQYEDKDVNNLFDIFEIAKASNYDLADYDFADFLQGAHNSKALEIKLYYLELQTKGAPLWEIYFGNVTPLEICNLYIKLLDIEGLINMFTSIRDSCLSIPTCFPEEMDRIYDYDGILYSLNIGIDKLVEIKNNYPSITLSQLCDLTFPIMQDVFPYG